MERSQTKRKFLIGKQRKTTLRIIIIKKKTLYICIKILSLHLGLDNKKIRKDYASVDKN